jgi:hypothetical protein
MSSEQYGFFVTSSLSALELQSYTVGRQKKEDINPL